jgi:hypothetical protein
MKIFAAGCLGALLLSAGLSRADDQPVAPAADATADSATITAPAPPPTVTETSKSQDAAANRAGNGDQTQAKDAREKAQPDSDSVQAARDAKEQLIEAQRMADAALQAAAASNATSSSASATSSSTSGASSESDVYYPSSSSVSTHHTMGEVADCHLGPDYSDPHHHSMGSLAP